MKKLTSTKAKKIGGSATDKKRMAGSISGRTPKVGSISKTAKTLTPNVGLTKKGTIGGKAYKAMPSTSANRVTGGARMTSTISKAGTQKKSTLRKHEK